VYAFYLCGSVHGFLCDFARLVAACFCACLRVCLRAGPLGEVPQTALPRGGRVPAHHPVIVSFVCVLHFIGRHVL
jgi:hypothetical protein